MTVPSKNAVPETSKRIPPDIIEEEDAPFIENHGKDKDRTLSKETDAKQELDLIRFSLGSATLGWCLFLMSMCVIISLWNPDNALVNNAFEAFKLIVMTVLGYIFGSNAKS